MKTLVLLSGGIDSAVCLALARGDERLAVGFDYGQPHVIELEHAAHVASAEGVPFEIVKLPSMVRVGAAGIVVAGRNAVFLSVGVALAAMRGYDRVAIGSNFSDWEDFPDCRPAFIKAMSAAFEAAEYGPRLWPAVLRMTKTQVVQKARELGVSVEATWTCYNPHERQPCGECYSCKAREGAGA